MHHSSSYIHSFLLFFVRGLAAGPWEGAGGRFGNNLPGGFWWHKPSVLYCLSRKPIVEILTLVAFFCRQYSCIIILMVGTKFQFLLTLLTIVSFTPHGAVWSRPAAADFCRHARCFRFFFSSVFKIASSRWGARHNRL